MMKVEAFISISDPWDLAGLYPSPIPCIVYRYLFNILDGYWECIADIDVGVVIDGKIYYRFRVAGRHVGVFPRKDKMTPAGFAPVDMAEGEGWFIGDLILRDDFPT